MVLARPASTWISAGELLVVGDQTGESQLMLALYRCGRQADALAVYLQRRAALARRGERVIPVPTCATIPAAPLSRSHSTLRTPSAVFDGPLIALTYEAIAGTRATTAATTATRRTRRSTLSGPFRASPGATPAERAKTVTAIL
jgi:hypothetical protein